MESVYHFVTIRVNETSWAHIWRLHSCYLETGYDRFAVCFPLNVPMVHSSTLVVATNGEHLTCGGFSLGETICFGILEFVINCFGSLSLSPRRATQAPSSWE
jgi:hypothetical protein